MFKLKSKVKSKNFNFVSTGNLIDTKRMDLTIKAFYKAFKGNTKITLTIFGQGPNHKSLEELINQYKLSDQVKLMGLCSRKKIAEQLSKSNCFVLVSQSETFGVAYIEALAMGVPVIATKCGGPEGFVNKDNGIMIDVDNEEQLIEAMHYMYKNIEKYDDYLHRFQNLYAYC
ncbi:MAG: glycosyltransferase [Miniphocaeibacter sp.]|uniref:glycosyltransferase n=1 Tax=Miniphocaeibacter sp. TaxID=3100973 RepID=UPI003BAE2C1A